MQNATPKYSTPISDFQIISKQRIPGSGTLVSMIKNVYFKNKLFYE